MDWALIKSTTESVFRDMIPGKPTFEPRWEESSDGNEYSDPATGWKVIITVTNMRTLARHRRWVVNEQDPTRQDEFIDTNSVMTMNLRVEAEYFDDDASRWALFLITRMKERIRFTQYAAQMKAANMALQSVGETINASRSHEGRVINIYTSDLLFAVGSTESTVEEDNGVDWFDRIELSSHIKDQFGDDIPGNFSDVVIDENGVQ